MRIADPAVSSTHNVYYGELHVSFEGKCFCLLVLMASWSRAAEPSAPHPAALDLVRAMRFDEIASEAAARGVRKAYADGLLTRQQFTCAICLPAPGPKSARVISPAN